ncbi:MAG: metallophosphoesterase, partial [Candidatus Micrarchaeia archaeon]
MKSFVFTSDWHLRGLPPSTIQTEGFLDLLFNRLSTILGRQVDFIIHGGDFFDSYVCDDISLLNQVISLLKECNKKIYIVPGNHDLIGYEQKSILWTSLKTLENAGLLKILPPGLNVIEGINFYVVYPTKDHGPHIYSGLKDCFVLTHNLVSTVKMPFKVTLTDEIAPYLKQCIVLCGDLHYPFVKV